MWKRRLIAAVAALLVAAAGAVMLSGYVARADERAMAGMETADVLVAAAPIPAGTAADALTKLVSSKTLPVKAITEGSLTSLTGLGSRVSTVDLQPGEQLLDARFVDPASVAESDEIKIPKGMQQVTVSMERPRMLGNLLAPGATVGVFLSMAKEGQQPAQTHAILHQVLVTQVGDESPGAPAADGKAEEAAPTGSVPVTFALAPADAERVLYGAEHGRLWLSLEPAGAKSAGTRVVTLENVYE